ncbi:phosphoadenosine phosphosulfate reductase family protein [Streptomyces caniscabiei]|uniref:phosphoadenosine phosphosulfate reductase family protein n=1 Tax=Streptomyces caniscabiei TaxID=2746961 RepID=UPI0029ABAFD4|nr:phosphoadenosine phosphosulfate reductase family protein [Streptomyces caniscabiei]MDX2986440.1 phosphoadenosine phosphosulfate reductase family protein [Streptomyces caniscabiei]
MTTKARLAKIYRKTSRAVAEGGDLMEAMTTASNNLTTLLDAMHQLAATAGLDSITPWRRLNAWAAFTDQRSVLVTLHSLAHRLDPIRMPIGYLTIHPYRHNPIDRGHRLILTTSGGKDSVVMEDVVCTQADERNALHKVVAIHNDLGTTGKAFSNQPVEWPGTLELVQRQTARYGIPLEVTKRPGGGLFDQLVNQRKKFPSAAARWCTSDQKTNEGMKVARRQETDIRQTEDVDHVVIYYLVGIRASESAGRKRKPEFVIDKAASTRTRTVIRWHPILKWTERDVWQHIKDRGLEYHPAYDAGMERLSCRLCVLATRADLVCAARMSPDLTADYVAAEEQIGHTFQNDLSIREIQEEAERLGEITEADIVRGTALERHLSDDAPTSPQQLRLCAA